MADFSLQDFWWNKPSRTESQLPALQLGVSIVQNKAKMDLAERQLADDMARTEIARAESMAKIQLQTNISAANAELAGAAAKITDWSDPVQMKPVYDLGARAGHLVGTKGWDGIINTHERAVTAKQRGANTQSLIDARAARAEMMTLEQARKDLLADSTIDLNDARIVELDDRMAVNLQKESLAERKFELERLRTDSSIEYDDARIRKLQQDINMGERRILIQEGNLALRKEELGQKGRKLDAREQASYNSRLKALNEEEKDVLSKTFDATESMSLRKLYGIKRNALIEKFYGPASTNAPVLREGLKTEDRTTNAPPAVVAPSNEARAAEIRDSFRSGKITKEQAMQQLRELGFQ